ncbi:MAG TPA: SRPBCC domain-containing protein [Acidimicrobiales bacterium]|nr:SRPBCC domain-containing protein [Acidimicrobiales bacterium]
MTDGVLSTGGRRPTVRLERVLRDPPSVVWRALTEPDELAGWFPCGVRLDEGGSWSVGARLTFSFPATEVDLTLTGEVLEVDPPHVLAYTWGDDVLRFELAPEGAGTRLTLVNELDAAAAARNAAGWEVCLDRLEGVGEGAPWWPRFEAYRSRFEPLLGVTQEGPPAGHAQG